MAVELKPIKTRKIYEEIIDQLKQLIVSGQLKPGDRLPSERDLVESLRVSRASIREALSALEMMGLLEVRSGEGTYVRELKPESVVEPLSWMLSMEKGTVLELLEVRKILEVQAVGIAAERITEDDLTKLDSALNEMIRDLQNSDGGEKSDLLFHFTITRATHNKILIRLMDTISDMMKHMLKSSRAELYKGKYTPELLLEEHMRIFDAIKSRDSELARLQMLKHLEGVEQELIKNM